MISPVQLKKITNFIKEYPKILISSELLKINRCVSYMTFMVKEILEYALPKTAEGELVASIRYSKTILNELNEKVVRLKAL